MCKVRIVLHSSVALPCPLLSDFCISCIPSSLPHILHPSLPCILYFPPSHTPYVHQVVSVRLPMESGTSRMRGFGYAELESVTALVDALSLSGEVCVHV